MAKIKLGTITLAAAKAQAEEWEAQRKQHEHDTAVAARFRNTRNLASDHRTQDFRHSGGDGSIRSPRRGLAIALLLTTEPRLS